MIPKPEEMRLRAECERIEDMIEGLEASLRSARIALRRVRRQLHEESYG